MDDKYACWCETTTARKAQDIHQAMADIKGLVATRAAEISSLSRDIANTQKAMDEANAIRQ